MRKRRVLAPAGAAAILAVLAASAATASVDPTSGFGPLAGRQPNDVSMNLSVAAPAAPARGSVDCVSFVNCASVRVDVRGEGSGTVRSDPSGIDCTVTAGVESGNCVEIFSWPKSIEYLRVELFGTPAEGSQGAWTITFFVRNGEDRVNGDRFELKPFALSVSRSGAGTGRVASEPAGISCGSDCTEEFAYGTTVRLTASPDAGAVFRAWTGACAGQGASCSLRIAGATSTNAVFELPSADPPPSSPPPPPSPPPPNSPPPPPTPPAGTDRFVDADVGAAAPARTRLGARAVRVELEAGEPLSATVQLRRSGKTLASKRYLRIGRGARLLTILVPPRLQPGPVTLRLLLADLAGNTLGARRQLTIGRR